MLVINYLFILILTIVSKKIVSSLLFIEVNMFILTKILLSEVA